MGLFSRLSDGLKKTRDNLSGAIAGALSAFTRIDEDLFEEIEEILVSADVGTFTAAKLCEELRQKVKQERVTDPLLVKGLLKDIISESLSGDYELNLSTSPSVVLVIGVNGAGKTTSIGKLALALKAEGKSVLLGAADTFRAAAIDQLGVWSDRADVPMVKGVEGSDPASVVYDTISSAKARKSDVIICDTAGRLHNKKNLMEELAKINRIIDRELPDSAKETLLVLDATTGQNAVNQAREFNNTSMITGIILTKLDGTARGGVVLAIKNELDIPVKYIGVGEKIEDLQTFNAADFANALIDG